MLVVAKGSNALTQAITGLCEAGSIVFALTHRPSALAAVNNIMILDKGRIVRFDEKEKLFITCEVECIAKR